MNKTAVRRVVQTLVIAALFVAAVATMSGAARAQAPQSVPAAPAAVSNVFIIRVAGEPAATYRGGVTGLRATNPAARGEIKFDVNSPDSVAYLAYLDAQHQQILSSIESTLGRSVELRYSYQVVYNGFAIVLNSDAEAAAVASVPGVVSIEREQYETLDTDRGPQWIGATALWDGSGVIGGVGTKGEGIVAGILDTGINFESPSFAAVGPVDGYVHVNPLGSGVYKGDCLTNPGAYPCNDKLIGAYDMVNDPGGDPDAPRDSDGHGSHTASTVAGNAVNSTMVGAGISTTRLISGVAPHANIIAYDVCVETCPGGALLAAANQAIIDQVDVINYSISGGTSPWTDAVELAFLDATDAGVFVSASAGNSGPGANTVAHRGPWVSTVAASTHDRKWENILAEISGTPPPPFTSLTGASYSGGYGPAPLVYAGDFGGNNLCQAGIWAPGTFSGQIVICDRGTNGRVEKSVNVGAAGGGGMVLVNDMPSGNSVVADIHAIPSVHVSYNEGTTLKTWVASATNPTARITGSVENIAASNGDIMAAFSSRGPSNVDVIKPDVTAPGVDIWAAFAGPPNSVNFLSGTSMSSPHNAGAGALMSDIFPTWSSSAIKSAMMSTADMTVLKEDGVTPADPFDIGAGRLQMNRAARAGFILEETRANYLAANPTTGGNPRTLNLASMQHSACPGTCSWTRTLTSVWATSVDYTTSGSSANVTVSPSTFTLAPGGTQVVTITFDGTALPLNLWTFASVTFTPSQGPIVQHMPIAVKLVAGATPTATATMVPTATATMPPTSIELGDFNRTADTPYSGWLLGLAGIALVSAGLIARRRR